MVFKFCLALQDSFADLAACQVCLLEAHPTGVLIQVEVVGTLKVRAGETHLGGLHLEEHPSPVVAHAGIILRRTAWARTAQS